jgi:hypothetical protein
MNVTLMIDVSFMAHDAYQMSTLDCQGRGLGIGAASFCITLTHNSCMKRTSEALVAYSSSEEEAHASIPARKKRLIVPSYFCMLLNIHIAGNCRLLHQPWLYQYPLMILHFIKDEFVQPRT